MRNPKERSTFHPKRNIFCAAITAISLFAAGAGIHSGRKDSETTAIIQQDIAILTLAAQARKNQSPRRVGEPIVIFDTAVLNFK